MASPEVKGTETPSGRTKLVKRTTGLWKGVKSPPMAARIRRERSFAELDDAAGDDGVLWGGGVCRCRRWGRSVERERAAHYALAGGRSMRRASGVPAGRSAPSVWHKWLRKARGRRAIVRADL